MRAEKIFKLAKGFRGRAKNTIRAARNRVEKALQYAYRDRKAKKREFRELWIQQINAATREHGVKYSEFMHGLKEENVVVDRKILAELARTEPYSFKALVDQVKRMKGIEERSRFAIKKRVVVCRVMVCIVCRFGFGGGGRSQSLGAFNQP